jgi:hypothetical protein
VYEITFWVGKDRFWIQGVLVYFNLFEFGCCWPLDTKRLELACPLDGLYRDLGIIRIVIEFVQAGSHAFHADLYVTEDTVA